MHRPLQEGHSAMLPLSPVKPCSMPSWQLLLYIPRSQWTPRWMGVQCSQSMSQRSVTLLRLHGTLLRSQRVIQMSLSFCTVCPAIRPHVYHFWTLLPCRLLDRRTQIMLVLTHPASCLPWSILDGCPRWSAQATESKLSWGSTPYAKPDHQDPHGRTTPTSWPLTCTHMPRIHTHEKYINVIFNVLNKTAWYNGMLPHTK